MNLPTDPSDQPQWNCARCGLPLEMATVNISYLGSGYPVELLTCPGCGLALIPEELAVGKMAEVEKILEDK
jgi:hypothetical protein